MAKIATVYNIYIGTEILFNRFPLGEQQDEKTRERDVSCTGNVSSESESHVIPVYTAQKSVELRL